MIRNSTPILLFFSVVTSLSAQTPTIQDCLGAIPICQQIYTESQSPEGVGNFQEVNPDISCSSTEDNSVWYTFTVNQTGDFGFLITPSRSNDDYDWWLFDITGGRCEDINNVAALTVSCNVAGGGSCDGLTGATGNSDLNQQGPGCNAWFPNANNGDTPYNDLVPVQAGNTYALCISNWTGSPFGYEIDFGYSSDIGILDEVPPALAEITPPTSCGDTKIGVTFSENIQCSTIEGSNFQLTGPGGPYEVALSSSICQSGGEYDVAFELTISPEIQSLGDFTLELLTNNTTEVLDLCDNPAPNASMDFAVTVPSDNLTIDLGEDSRLICTGDNIELDASTTATGATYLWQDGSTEPIYNVTSAGLYSVTVTTSCGSDTDAVEVNERAPLPEIDLGEDKMMCEDEPITLDATSVENATYTWQDGSTNPTLTVNTSGTYSVTVTNGCDTQTSSLDIFYNDDFTISLGADRSVCEGEEITLSLGLNDVDIQWQDGSTGTEYIVTQSGRYSVTVTTPCTEKVDDILVTYVNKPVVNLGNDTTLCPNQSILLDATSEGSSYVWQDGSTEPIFEALTSGAYQVTISNACGEISRLKNITYVPKIEVDLNADSIILCEGERYLLDAFNVSAEHYVWDDGSNEDSYYATGPGQYSVRVSNTCEEVVETVDIQECTRCEQYVPNAFSPNGDGFNDYFQAFSNCPMQDYQLRVFDRWGNEVFFGEDPMAGWDGQYKNRPMTTGVYVWQALFTVVEDGEERLVSEKGDILLTR